MKEIKRTKEVLTLKSGIDKEKLKERFLKLDIEIFNVKEDFMFSCDDKKLIYLFEKLLKLIQENTEVGLETSTHNQAETIEEIKEKCGEKFIAELKELFKNIYAIHATGVDDPNVFFEDAFRIYGSQELISTTYTSRGSIDLLLDFLFNEMHMGYTKIVVLDATQEDVKETGEVGPYSNMAYISNEHIKAYIDLDKKKIFYNPHYKERLVRGENKFIDNGTKPPKPIELKFERDYFEKDEKDYNIRYLDDVIINLYSDLSEMILVFPDEDGHSKGLDKQSIDYADKVLDKLKKLNIQKYRDEYSVQV